MKKLLLLFVCALLINGCGGDDSPSDDPIIEVPIEEEPTATQIGIDINGLEGFDYTNVKAMGFDIEETFAN